MTDAMRTFRSYLTTHDKLRQEIRPLPTLDPGTDRPDDTEQSVVNATFDVMRILGEPDDVLFQHLDDLRSIARAINQRITSIED